MDWVYNVEFLKSKGNLFNTLGFGNNIHGGFASLANYAYEEFNKNEKIKSLIEKGAAIQVAGHSLGGAMAQVLGNQLRKKYREKVSLMTFCQPPAFDANEADHVTEEFSGDYLRFFNPQDIVHNSLFNIGNLLPGDLNIWYKHSGIGIEIDQDILTKFQNFIIPVLNAHNMKNNAAALPRTLKNYIAQNSEIYKTYKQSQKNDKTEKRRLEALEYLSCFFRNGNEYTIEWKKNSKAQMSREIATRDAIQNELRELKEIKASVDSKNTAKRIKNFAILILQRCEDIPDGGSLGCFVRTILQTLHKHVPKKTPEYAVYREEIVAALITRFHNYSHKSARDALRSIGYLYEKDFSNLKIASKHNKDVEPIKKSLAKIDFLKEQLKKMQDTLEAQTSKSLTLSQYSQAHSNTEEIEDCIDQINNIIKTSESALYTAYNDALCAKIKKDQSKKKSDSMTYARELAKLGLEIDAYHFSFWGLFYQGPKKIEAQTCFEKLMKYYGYNDAEINRELKNPQMHELKQRPYDKFEGISDNESDGEAEPHAIS